MPRLGGSGIRAIYFCRAEIAHADLELFIVSHSPLHGIDVQFVFHHLDTIGDQLFNAVLSAGCSPFLAHSHGLDYHR